MSVDRKGLAQRPALLIAVCLGAALLAAGVLFLVWLLLLRSTEPYPGLSSLAGQDPQGAEACQLLAEWRDGKHLDEVGEPENEALISSSAADHAAEAVTPGIQELASEAVLGIRFIDLDELRDACVAAGVGVP